MNGQTNRRDFLKRTTWAGAGALVVGSRVLASGESPNEKLNIGIVGNYNRLRLEGLGETHGHVRVVGPAGHRDPLPPGEGRPHVDLGEVGDTDRAAPDLVFIGRPDAAPGRADLGDRVLAFACPVEDLNRRPCVPEMRV